MTVTGFARQVRTTVHEAVREVLVEWGWLTPTRYHLRRRAAGAVRATLLGRGRCPRTRRTSLRRLLEGCGQGSR